MNSIKILLPLLLISNQAFAARDALGVFFRPEKTLIVITEGGVLGRLQKFFKYAGAQQDMQLLTADQSFKMDCVRDVSVARCQFRLLPSEKVRFEGKKIEAHLPLKDLGLSDKGPLELAFESANGDRLDMVISDGLLHFYGSKAR